MSPGFPRFHGARLGQSPAAPLPRAECVLLALVAGHLCFLPWALGDMHVWSQAVSAALSAASLAVALGTGARRAGAAARLLRDPVFWLGGLVLGYILTQALNPAWRYMRNDSFWWLVRIPHVDALPSGMDTPFGLSSPWRSLLIYGSAWMTVCAVGAGFTRRRTVRWLLTVLAVNAFLLALVGLVERASRADRIFWLWKPPAGYFVSSFIYKNHAGAYFNLMLSICAGLAVWHHERSQRRLERCAPGGLFIFFSAVLVAQVVFSYSRGATLLLAVFLLPLFIVLVRQSGLRSGTARATWLTPALFAGAAGGLCVTGFYTLPRAEIVDRMGSLFTEYRSATPDLRRLATQATLHMARAEPLYGWGSGSFRFAFPFFQGDFTQLGWAADGSLLSWEHAHDDYAELFAELGVVGFSGVVAMGGCLAGAWIRRRSWRNPIGLAVGAGCLATLVHSAGDFNFYNPAILITWGALWPAMALWVDLDSRAQGRRGPRPR
jgi:hypothetical protein